MLRRESKKLEREGGGREVPQFITELWPAVFFSFSAKAHDGQDHFLRLAALTAVAVRMDLARSGGGYRPGTRVALWAAFRQSFLPIRRARAPPSTPKTKVLRNLAAGF